MNLIQRAFADIFTFTRASGGGRINASGVYEWVAANQPRFDYDPVTLQPKGILIEEQRTNLWLNSNWPGVYYQSQVVTVTPNYGASPISGVNSGRLTRTADSNQTSINFTVSGGISAATVPQAPSVFMKLNSAQPSFSVYAGNGNSTQGQYFNFTVSGGVITPIDGGKAEKYGGGWWRLSFPFTPSSSISASANLTFGFPVGDLDAEFVGFQWEAGSFATSYIPTSGSQVTRAADNIFINSLSPFYNQSEGCVAVEFSRQQASGSINLPLVQPSAGSVYGLLYTNPSQIKSYDGTNSIQSSISNPFSGLSNTTKAAVAWSSAGMAHAADGALGMASGAWVNSSEWYNGAWRFCFGAGHATLLKRIRYFPKRPSAARLQSITA